MSRKSRALECGYCDGAVTTLSTCDVCILRCCHADIFNCSVEGCRVQICRQCRNEDTLAARRVHEAWQCARHHELGVQHGNMVKVSDMVKSSQAAEDTQANYICEYQNKPPPFGEREIRECCVALSRLGGRQKEQASVDGGKKIRIQVATRQTIHSLHVAASLKTDAGTPIRLKAAFPLFAIGSSSWANACTD